MMDSRRMGSQIMDSRARILENRFSRMDSQEWILKEWVLKNWIVDWRRGARGPHGGASATPPHPNTVGGIN